MNSLRTISKYLNISRLCSRFGGQAISVLILFLALLSLLPQPASAAITRQELQDLYIAAQTDATKCAELGTILNEELKNLTDGNRIGVTTTYGTQFVAPVTFNGRPVSGATSSCFPAKFEDGQAVVSPDMDHLAVLIVQARGEALTRSIQDISVSNAAKNAAAAAAKAAVAAAANTIALILSAIIKVITSVLLAVSALAGGFLSIAIDYNSSVAQPDAVNIGWRIIRDLMNMVFILALIAMSLATILQIETYNYKKLLTKLIIMALLINFSQVIANTLISFSNVLIDVFKGDGAWLTGYHSKFSSIVDYYSYNNVGLKEYFLETGGLSDLALSFTGLLLALVMVVSFLVVAGLLLIRIVGLWVLVIFSPIAYALNILPATEQYAKKWWETFIKYLIWAPVAVLVLRIGSLVLEEGSFQNRLTGQNSIFFFIIVMAFMWAAVIVAKQAGMVGADMVIKGAQAVGFGLPKWGAKQGLGAADRWLGKGQKSGSMFRRGLSYLSPGAWKAGYEKYRKEEERRAFGITGGQRADTLYRRLPWQREKTSFGLEAHQDEVLHRAKEKMDLNMSEREMVEEMLHAKDPIDKQGWGMAIVGLNRQDDFTRILKEKLIDKDGNLDEEALNKLSIAREFQNPLTGRIEKIQDILKTGRITPENFQKLFYGMYLASISEKEKVSYASMMQEYGEKQNKPYHLADNIEVETTDAAGNKRIERRVNYGYADLRSEAIELEQQAKTRELNGPEKERLEHFNAVVGQYKSRMNRTPANKFLNGMRAADIDVQFSDAESAKLAGFEGESYGDIHNTGLIIQGHFGLPHASQLRNRQHELQARGVIPFGAKGEDVAPDGDEFSFRRAVSSAAANPVVMDVFLREKGPALKVKIFSAAIARAEELKLPESAAKLRELTAKYVKDVKESGGGVNGGGGPVLYGSDNRPITGSATASQAPRTVIQQATNEIIRETSVRSEHLETLKNTVTQAHSGDIDFGEVESRLHGLGMTANQVAKSMTRIKDSVSSARVQSADPHLFEAIPGISPEAIRQAVKQGIREGFGAGSKMGMPAMLASISSNIKKLAPGTANIDRLAGDIAEAVNKGK